MSTGRLGAGDTAIQPTIFDAKGDLLTATAGDTPARIAVGNSGETLVADSSATTGLRWQSNFAAGKNKIINGAFNIWQRGTSFASIATATYSADRFRGSFDGTGVRTVSRQNFTPGTAPVAGYEGQFFCRIDQTTAGTGGTFNRFMQRVEGGRTFAGETVTLSFWVKADSSRTLSVELAQNFGTGGSPSAEVTTATTNVSATTSWNRVSATYTLASVSGKTFGTNNDDFLQITLNLPQNTTSTIDIWGWQLEAGSVATAFQTATGTLAGELAACQRYYYLHSSGASQPLNVGYMTSATQVQVNIKFPVTMRSNPSLSATSGTNYYSFNRNGAVDEFNSFTLDLVNTNTAQIYNASEISGTVGQAGTAYIGNASGSVAFSAEL